jgi:hypothetical protein
VLLLALTLTVACAGTPPPPVAPASTSYDDLVALFQEWREFQKPAVENGVPDYTAAAMAAQHEALAGYQARLAAIDPSGWAIAEQADYHVVRAEMNGLDFDHRVIRPWARDPAFYVTAFPSESDQPAREGHYAYPSTELWQYPLTLNGAAVEMGLRAIPALLEQARTNLVGDGRDLWTYGIGRVQQQSAALEGFAARLTDPDVDGLRAAADEARAATDEFIAWLESESYLKTGLSGIGRDNYDWYLEHVSLLPYTWQDMVTIMERELARAVSALALEEQRNAALPPQRPVQSAAEYESRFQVGVTDFMAFIADHEIMTVRDYMDPALRARGGRYTAGAREFFTEVDHHDPQVMRTHGYHWWDKARMVNLPHPSPIRRGPLLYNIFISRTEGLATGWEELMLDAGMFDDRPRSRELIYILLAQRAARALGDLRQHANLATLDEVSAFTSAHTPRGWLSLDGRLVWGEQLLYLRQPTYGISYVVGKIQIEQLLADRKRQLGDAFTMRQFMDEFDATGLIPITLIRWELTGEMTPDLMRVIQ